MIRLAVLLLLLGAAPAGAQLMLYEQRLPEGFGFVRFASALPDAATIRPDFGPAVPVGVEGAERVSAYQVAEGAKQRPIRLTVEEAGQPSRTVEVPISADFSTVVLRRDGATLSHAVTADEVAFNQTRARLSFFHLIPGCANGALTLEQGNQAVFSNMAPDTMRMRSVNPTAATVRASCATARAAPLPLGRLEAGGLYSVWFMAPRGEPVAFLARDTIAPRR
ncbi:MAG: ABC transporter permease [Acetobacteraceae bacterium]|nr:ABC transporter permease [Acetobacteraceae bacterium]